MTKLEIEQVVKTVFENYDRMRSDELSLYNQLIDLERNISDIENRILNVRDEIFSLHDIFNNGILPVGGNVLMKNYRDFGFRSDIVKDCVSVVRKLFFDDTDPDSRKFDCINICDSYLYAHVGTTFTFYDGNRTIGIDFVSAMISKRGGESGIGQRVDYVGEKQTSDHPYTNIVMKDVVGSIEVAYERNMCNGRSDTIRLQPTRDIESARKFVQAVVKGRK